MSHDASEQKNLSATLPEILPTRQACIFIFPNEILRDIVRGLRKSESGRIRWREQRRAVSRAQSTFSDSFDFFGRFN